MQGINVVFRLPCIPKPAIIATILCWGQFNRDGEGTEHLGGHVVMRRAAAVRRRLTLGFLPKIPFKLTQSIHVALQKKCYWDYTLAETDLLCMLKWGTQWTMVSYLKK